MSYRTRDRGGKTRDLGVCSESVYCITDNATGDRCACCSKYKSTNKESSVCGGTISPEVGVSCYISENVSSHIPPVRAQDSIESVFIGVLACSRDHRYEDDGPALVF